MDPETLIFLLISCMMMTWWFSTKEPTPTSPLSKRVFLNYAQVSGQFVNPQKSSILAGFISNHRLT